MGLSTSKEQLLAKAIEVQDIEKVKHLIKDQTNEQKRTICSALVLNDDNQYTIFHYAVWQDNPELLTLLIDYVDDLEIRDGLQWTPLMTAVNRGSKENVKILLKHGAKINCDSLNGADLIASAMSFNDPELVEILIDHGAQVTVPSEHDDDDGNSSQCHLLHFAADDGLTNIGRLLIEKGKIPIDTLDQSGWSPLHIAAGHNQLDFVELLLQHNANINIKDRDGNTPLAWAREMKAEEVINELEKHGAIADSEWHGEILALHNLQDHELQGIDNIDFENDETIETPTDSNVNQYQ